MYLIPVNNQPNQSFDIVVPVDGVNRNFRFFFRWNLDGEYWTMNIIDLEDGQYKLLEFPLYGIMAPYQNLIHQYKYKKIGSCYLRKIALVDRDRPNYEDLGASFQLLWGDTPNE